MEKNIDCGKKNVDSGKIDIVKKKIHKKNRGKKYRQWKKIEIMEKNI